LAAIERDRLAARLRARPLLGQEKLATVEIRAAPAEHERNLDREEDLAVQILMHAVVAAGVVAQHQRSRFDLSLAPADFQEGVELGGKALAEAESAHPVGRDWREALVKRRAHRGYQRRQRRGTIFVFAEAIAEALHYDAI